MKTNKNNDIEKIKFIQLSLSIMILEVVIMIVTAITMTIGVIRFDIKQYASSVTAFYLVMVISLIVQWFPLWTIHKILNDIKNSSNT